MSNWKRLSRAEMAARAAGDIPDGSYVNLGIGIPTLVSRHLPAGRDVILHSENGIVGMGPAPADGIIDTALVNASKEPVTLLPGASITDHATSFAMMRGGHIDLTILGAYQVSREGDLANWDTGAPDAIPAVGGAMDLVVGARQAWVLMEHVTKDGKPRIVEHCSYPLTGTRVVDRIYTDLAVIDIQAGRLMLRWMVDGLSFDALQAITGAPLEQPR
ncbi:3-oxoacid CoA-transferase subunit B [Noviherbaspirillum sp. Root189]|uniref:3-oxoacid CoA-transferase subunit B n=1 Tax=Noviherbaspirillum sp. Root189 TaxID=1736487 RepID=UPI00070CEE92|nr:3-oxoacid CoA-transferase subunit B [Noviherbaspirillum sp. Root189]KRB67991.1 3-oxoadipate CoA-transferase [Noviherbaspirillum sp. Root189]